jgi:trehalose-phosphatase
MNNIAREKIWFFDFDGTLSSIVPQRTKAELHPECGKMLQRLVSNPMFHVAILSSRKLEDLASRVPVRGLFLGGTSGTEWQVPGGHRMTLSGKASARLKAIRKRILPELRDLAEIPGVVIEDKKWSVALHTRKASEAMKLVLSSRLSHWNPPDKIRVFKGPEVYEVQFVPKINKSFGVRTLCKFLKFRPCPEGLFYAGDDENDAMAMRLVSRLGGTAVTVGESPLIPSSRVVKDQHSLAEEVCNMMSL